MRAKIVGLPFFSTRTSAPIAASHSGTLAYECPIAAGEALFSMNGKLLQDDELRPAGFGFADRISATGLRVIRSQNRCQLL